MSVVRVLNHASLKSILDKAAARTSGSVGFLKCTNVGTLNVGHYNYARDSLV